MRRKIQFNMNYQKAVEAVLYILSQFKEEGLNTYNLLKMIFAADKYHLNKYGRPVTGDTYIKMNYGTVPSVIYEYIKQDPMALSTIADKECPFFNKEHNTFPKREYKPEFLSESDEEALNYGKKEYENLTFNQVKEKNHDEKCWVETGMNMPVDFELMIDDEEIINDLKENSVNIIL
jgi:hypothetical protein